MGAIKRGEVWRFRLDPTVGSELQKVRPCVIIQRDAANRVSPTTIVCPISSVKRPNQSNQLNVPIQKGEAGLSQDSVVICNQIRTLDTSRIVGNALGVVSAQTMILIEDGLRAILDLDNN